MNNTPKTSPKSFSRCRILPLLPVMLAASSFASLELRANPPGHQKLLYGDYYSELGYSININEYLDVLLTPAGTTYFKGYFNSRVYSVTPAGFSILLGENMAAPGGRYISQIDDDRVAFNHRGDMAFFADTRVTATNQIGTSGIFLSAGGVIRTIADERTSAPGGGVFDDSFPDIRISNNGKYVVFRSYTTGGPGSGLYFADVSVSPIQVRSIAVVGDASPDGGRFDRFSASSDGLAVINSGVVVFDAATTLNSGFETPLFSWDGTQVREIPGTEAMQSFQINDNGNLMFQGFDRISTGSVSGVNSIARSGDQAPGGGVFRDPLDPILNPAGAVAFRAEIGITNVTYENGVYLWEPAIGLKKIMLTSDTPPGGGIFEEGADIFPLAIFGDKVYFQAGTSGGNGIFVSDGTKLEKVIRTGDILEGQVVTEIIGYSSNPRNTTDQTASNQNGKFVYYAEVGGEQGLFIYDSLSVSPNPKLGFTNAMTLVGLSGADALATATPHDDDVNNLLKYAFNMNLSDPDFHGLIPGTGTSGLPSITFSRSGSTTTLRVEFVRRIRSGLIYSPRRSSELTGGSWLALSDVPTVTKIDTTWERVIYEESLPTASNPKCFAVVKVTLP